MANSSSKSWSQVFNCNHIFDIEFFQCSIRTCSSSKGRNRATVADFKEKFAQPKTTLHCYFDPWHPSGGVVLRVDKPGLEVFHAVFWPFASLLCCLCSCTVFCHWCRKNQALVTKEVRPSNALSHGGIEIDCAERQGLTQGSPGITITGPPNPPRPSPHNPVAKEKSSTPHNPGTKEKTLASNAAHPKALGLINLRSKPQQGKHAIPRSSSSSCAKVHIQNSCVDASKYVSCDPLNLESPIGRRKPLLSL